MPPIDPFAPASHPNHPRNAGGRAGQFEDLARQGVADLVALEEQQRQERAELQATHLTPAEKAARDSSGVPDLDTLRLRRDALVDYLERREADANAEVPTIVDANGDTHSLVVSDDGREAHWEPAPPHDPPTDGDGYDDLTNADLEQLLKDRKLPHSGVKPDLILRLRHDDAHRASRAAAEGVVMVPEGDPLDSALADLDRVRGKR